MRHGVANAPDQLQLWAVPWHGRVSLSPAAGASPASQHHTVYGLGTSKAARLCRFFQQGVGDEMHMLAGTCSKGTLARNSFTFNLTVAFALVIQGVSHARLCTKHDAGYAGQACNSIELSRLALMMWSTVTRHHFHNPT